MNLRVNLKNMHGSIKIPPSKSLSHRAIIAACLANGESKIENVILSDDITATIHAMEALGANISINDTTLYIKGSKPKRVKDEICCNESGSTARFIIPLALSIPGKVTFTGKNNLVNRPQSVYLDIFNQQNIRYEKKDKELPLTVYGPIKPGEFNVKGDISSQFITGLLYTLPLLDGNSVINVTTPLESKGYIDLTIYILNMYGINIINNNYQSFVIEGNQKYKPSDYIVEGDYSQAAFYLVAGSFLGNIELKQMNKDSLQGDKEILDILKRMNVKFEFNESIIVNKSESIGTIIDLSQAPDLGPIIMVLASLSIGRTKIINASRLRIKECDRLKAMTTELNKLGAKIIETHDGAIIDGVKSLKGGNVESYNDHRIAMSMAIASIKSTSDIIINDAMCVNKSYPNFYEDVVSLGGIVNE